VDAVEFASCRTDGAGHPAGSTKQATLSLKDTSMTSTNGTIKRITDKGFGFIATAEGMEYFFHQSACASTPFDQLREGHSVSFTVGHGPKGPRAENVHVR
jgi:CspA family cold shock protein